MLGLILKELFLPVAVSAVKSYISSSSTKKDDKILEVVQEGAKYLVDSSNNTIEKDTKIDDLENCLMRSTQKSQG